MFGPLAMSWVTLEAPPPIWRNLTTTGWKDVLFPNHQLNIKEEEEKDEGTMGTGGNFWIFIYIGSAAPVSEVAGLAISEHKGQER